MCPFFATIYSSYLSADTRDQLVGSFDTHHTAMMHVSMYPEAYTVVEDLECLHTWSFDLL
jgi:hypothetical protein